MCDKLVFDLAQEIEGSPSVFVRKDWLNILDNQNQNYNNNQSVIDTSQLSNSNKWMNYREAYLSIPLLLSIGLTDRTAANGAQDPAFNLAGGSGSVDYAYGLKNWFGQIIHSFTLDYNGTTIIQQTPLSNMWNSFRLMTSLSYNDLLTQGDVIGFHPDDATSWEMCQGASYTQAAAGNPAIPNSGNVAPSFKSGSGVCNNTTSYAGGRTVLLDQLADYLSFNSAQGNKGFVRRIQNINFDLLGIPSLQASSISTTGTVPTGFSVFDGLSYGQMVSGGANAMTLTWKSYISAQDAVFQQTSIIATVYLKHIHSFFNMVPLLKGVFMKMTMNLNNSSATVFCTSTNVGGTFGPKSMVCSSVSVPTGGVLPFLISSPSYYQSTGLTAQTGSWNLFPQAGIGAGASGSLGYTLNLSVGAVVLNSTLSTAFPGKSGTLSKSVYLYIPAYTFNPPFESSYLSSPVKVIKYTDIYQYQVLSIPPGSQFNNLITNGIANIKSVLILPFYSASSSQFDAQKTPAATGFPGQITLSGNTGFLSGTPVWQSPFDPAGTGPTSPLCFLTNFNVQISGQNAIYNVEKYSFEQFNNQLYGQNSVNGGLTDGLTSGLIGRTEFDMEYCYYYVNVERMLPVEETVPKSVQILGNNLSSRALDFYVFIEYGMEVKIDALTGARV